MTITEIKTLRASPYKTKKQMAEEFSLSPGTIQSRIKEIEQQPRYGKYAVLRDGRIVLVNYLAFIDWLRWRKFLTDKNAKKVVPDYDPQRIAMDIGWYGKENE